MVCNPNGALVSPVIQSHDPLRQHVHQGIYSVIVCVSIVVFAKKNYVCIS